MRGYLFSGCTTDTLNLEGKSTYFLISSFSCDLIVISATYESQPFSLTLLCTKVSIENNSQAFSLGQHEDCSRGDISSYSFEKLSQRSKGKGSIYMILVKGGVHAIKHYFL